jgi:hypothetical protein
MRALTGVYAWDSKYRTDRRMRRMKEIKCPGRPPLQSILLPKMRHG